MLIIWLRCDALGQILEVDIALILTKLGLCLLDGTDLFHRDSAVVESILSGTWIVLTTSFDIFVILSLLGTCTAPGCSLSFFLRQLDRGVVSSRTQWLREEFMLCVVRLTLVRVQIESVFVPSVVSEWRGSPGC